MQVVGLYINLWIAIFLGILPQSSPSQTNVRQLEEQLSQSKNAFQRYDLLIDLSQTIQKVNREKALEYAKSALNVAETLYEDSLIHRAHIQVGRLMVYTGRVQDGIILLQRLEEAIESSNDSTVIVETYDAIALANFKLGNYKTAADYMLSAIQYSQDKSTKARKYNNLGSIFERIQNNTKAALYYEKARTLHAETGNQKGYASSSGNLGVVYFNEGKYEEALELLRVSEREAALSRDSVVIGIRWQNIGNIYNATQNYDSAYYYLNNAYQLSAQIKDTIGLISLGNSLGKLFIQNKQFNKAISILTPNIQFLENYDDAYEMMNARHSLMQAFKGMDNYEKAFAESVTYKYLSDSISKIRADREVQELEIKYQAVENEKILQAQQFELERKTIQRNTFMWIAVLVFILGAGITLSLVKLVHSNRALAAKELLIQKEELERLRQKQQIIAFKAMIQGEEAERSRLARDLHDGLGSMLSTIKLTFGRMAKGQNLNDAESTPYTDAISLVDKANNELRRIAHNMMPETLAKFGLLTALEDLCDEINLSQKLHITFQHFDVECSFSDTVTLSIYRIIQELLNNIIKHAEATEVILQLVEHSDHLHITVEDNGKGFDPNVKNGKGFGLQNIHSRVEFLGGMLEIDSQPTHGTSVNIQILIPEHDTIVHH